ncbi:MAG: hypothetical protein WC119_01400 [Synergistaceae bacterium]
MYNKVMQIEKPEIPSEKELSRLIGEREKLTIHIKACQAEVIRLAKSEDSRVNNGNSITTQMKINLDSAQVAHRHLDELESKIHRVTEVYNKEKEQMLLEYEEMKRVVSQLENDVWQSAVSQLEV